MNPQKISTKIFNPQKIFIFLKAPKNIVIQTFERKKMGQAYVYMKISEYTHAPLGYVSMGIERRFLRICDRCQISLRLPIYKRACICFVTM